MKTLFLSVSIILLSTLIFTLNAEELIFTDDFDAYDSTKVSFTNNIKYENGYVVLNNTSLKSGEIISSLISLSTNQKWYFLYVSSTNTNVAPPTSITVFLLDSSDNVIYTNNGTSSDISYITNKSIKIKAKLRSPSGNGTPLLDYWKIEITLLNSITGNEPLYSDFYAAPTPYKINKGVLQFYYKIEKDCTITLKIYDINYSLVKIIVNKEPYSAGTFLEATWNGKNGKGEKVLSGTYIAVLTIKNNDDSSNIESFVFGVIR